MSSLRAIGSIWASSSVLLAADFERDSRVRLKGPFWGSLLEGPLFFEEVEVEAEELVSASCSTSPSPLTVSVSAFNLARRVVAKPVLTIVSATSRSVRAMAKTPVA